MTSLNHQKASLYAYDTCIFYQNKDVLKIEDVLNKEFSRLCEKFFDNRLSVHFGKDKFILISKTKHSSKLDISYRDYMKQHHTVEYLGWRNYGSGSFKNPRQKLNFLIDKTPRLKRLLCKVLIQRHFDNGCTVWFPLLNKNLKQIFRKHKL